MALSIPTAEIAWKYLPRLSIWTAKTIAKKFVIDIEPEKGSNPSISVFYEIAQIRYKFLLQTHGIPKYSKKVKFPKVLSFGEVLKKAVSPSNLGEVDGSLKLRLYTDEMPANSELTLFIDFDVKVDTRKLISMNFTQNQKCITNNQLAIEVMATSKCDFPLEQILLEVDKSTNIQIQQTKVLILDKKSHCAIKEIEPQAIIKGDDKIKWVTHFDPHESLLFKVVVTP